MSLDITACLKALSAAFCQYRNHTSESTARDLERQIDVSFSSCLLAVSNLKFADEIICHVYCGFNNLPYPYHRSLALNGNFQNLSWSVSFALSPKLACFLFVMSNECSCCTRKCLFWYKLYSPGVSLGFGAGGHLDLASSQSVCKGELIKFSLYIVHAKQCFVLIISTVWISCGLPSWNVTCNGCSARPPLIHCFCFYQE